MLYLRVRFFYQSEFNQSCDKINLCRVYYRAYAFFAVEATAPAWCCAGAVACCTLSAGNRLLFNQVFGWDCLAKWMLRSCLHQNSVF